MNRTSVLLLLALVASNTWWLYAAHAQGAQVQCTRCYAVDMTIAELNGDLTSLSTVLSSQWVSKPVSDVRAALAKGCTVVEQGQRLRGCGLEVEFDSNGQVVRVQHR